MPTPYNYLKKTVIKFFESNLMRSILYHIYEFYYLRLLKKLTNFPYTI